MKIVAGCSTDYHILAKKAQYFSKMDGNFSF